MHAQTMAVFGALSGIVGGGVAGFFLGRRFRATGARRRFWAASGVSLALGMGVIFLGQLLGYELLTGLGIGLMTGGLNGLRWGMGRLADQSRPRPERSEPGTIERRGQLPTDPSQAPAETEPSEAPRPGAPGAAERVRRDERERSIR